MLWVNLAGWNLAGITVGYIDGHLAIKPSSGSI